MTLEAEDYAHAHRDLGQQGLPGSFLYALIWLLVTTTTPVATTWPNITWLGLGIFVITGTLRFSLGFWFDNTYFRDTQRWAATYYTVVLVQAATLGGLSCFLIWQFELGWPAMMISFASAGVIAGGVVALSTHPKLQRGYIFAALVPTAVAGLASGNDNLMMLGFLVAVYIFFLVSIGKKLDRGYWDSMRSTRLLKRRAEELLVAREKAESADRAKGQFVAKVSHELRTPLNGLISTIGMMGRTDDPAKRTKYLSIMSKSADMLLQRINEILDFSKMQAGKLELEPVAADPSAAVADAVALMQDAAADKGLEIQVDISRPDHAWVSIDEMRLTQVLLNLISNAIKFTQQGTIVVAFQQGEIENGSVSCRFTVTDTGIGIAPDAKDRIFRSFEQADSSTTRQYGGTGLGLAVSQDLVQKMGGLIEVESTPGEGSCFSFTLLLPVAEMHNETRTIAEDGGTEIKTAPRLRVLIAEDNSINQFIIEDLMETLDCAFTIVADGQACVERVQNESYDVVLMDCEMPVMDGYEATRRIRSLERSDNRVPIPIIALTAHADETNRRKTSEVGMNDFVTKPFTLEELSAALERTLRTDGPMQAIA
ncbi:ATP-binding protein [Thiosocius teredinicola]|uniref:ATP-binding protein n=1 Tax=Thiosocius teredinicola TaxID=1973002 RepID=UPI0013DD9067